MKDAKGHGSDPRGAHASGVDQIGHENIPLRAASAANWKNFTEDVPISWLRQLPGNGLRKDVAELAADIQKNGVQEPLIISVGKDIGTAKLGEGNHRLAALDRLGYDYAPTRVIVGSEYGKEKLPRSDMKGDLIPKKGEYFTADARPSAVFKSLIGKVR